MPGQLTVDRLQAALKEMYLLEPVTRVYRDYNFALSNMEMKAGTLGALGGRSMKFKLENSGVESFRWMSEGEPVAEASIPTWSEATVLLASCSSQIEFDIWSEGYTRSQEASVIRGTAKLLSSCVERFATKLSLSLWGDGTGAMGVVKTVTSATVLTLYADGESGGLETLGVKAFFKGMKISASANKIGAIAELAFDQELTGVNPSANTITMTSTAGVVTGSILYWGSKVRTSKNRAWNGFRLAFDDGTLAGATSYQGIDRTATGNEFWKGNLETSFGTKNIEAGFIRNLHLVRKLIRANTDVIITSLGVWRAYFNELKEDRRAVVPVSSQAGLNFHGGFDSLAIHDGKKTVAIVADEEAPAGKAWGFRWSDFFFGRMYEPQWLDKGEGMFKNKAEHLEYAAYFFAIMQVVCRQPQAQWLISDMTEAS